MRKLRLQMQLSVDGYCAGPNHELDWLIWNFDDQLRSHLNELTDKADCILLGRNLAEGFIPTWKERLTDPAGEDPWFVRKMNETQKVVFSTTLKKSGWENTVLAGGDFVAEINQLKRQPGGDMILYGGNSFAGSVIKAGLIDEFDLYIHPTALGRGLAPFTGKTDLELVLSKNFPCGIVWMRYKPKMAGS